MEGPGSSEERNKVVEDWESKVLGSESAEEEMKHGHSGIYCQLQGQLSIRY